MPCISGAVVLCLLLRTIDSFRTVSYTHLDVYKRQLLEGVDLVVTGEGRMDWQSAFGKVPSGIGQRCKERGIPVVAIVGGMGMKAETIFDYGVDSIMTTINGAMELEEALERSEELYAGAADRMFRMLKAGTVSYTHLIVL